jgi:hypothetical protein
MAGTYNNNNHLSDCFNKSDLVVAEIRKKKKKMLKKSRYHY